MHHTEGWKDSALQLILILLLASEAPAEAGKGPGVAQVRRSEPIHLGVT